MLFVEYTESGTQKAINIALCYEIEKITHETDSDSSFYLQLSVPNGKGVIEFKTEEQLNSAFESLMHAIQEKAEYVKIPDPFAT